jgi:hypothetical protein
VNVDRRFELSTFYFVSRAADGQGEGRVVRRQLLLKSTVGRRRRLCCHCAWFGYAGYRVQFGARDFLGFWLFFMI